MIKKIPEGQEQSDWDMEECRTDRDECQFFCLDGLGSLASSHSELIIKL
jgi:hypothetical protein